MKQIFYKGKSTTRRLILMAVDLLCHFAFIFLFICSYAIMGREFTYLFKELMPVSLITAAVLIISRGIGGLYRCVWRYANSRAYLRMIIFDGVSSVITIVAVRTFFTVIYPGFWACATVCMGSCLAALLNRLTYQRLYQNTNKYNDDTTRIRIAIVGAGQIGCLLADELLLNPNADYLPICFVDNDTTKIGSYIRDLPVYEENEDVIRIINGHRIQEIFFAMPAVSGERMSELMSFYGKTGCKLKVYGLPTDPDGDFVDKNAKRVIRDIKIEDLLFRESLVTKDEKVDEYYTGKTILVTGGGGSIGSELCRQIALRNPKKLIIVDIYENNAYDVQQELLGIYKDKLDLAVEIASVRDKRRMDIIFESYKPEIVFHAAAHKHVPLMEHSSAEAIKNNVFGTLNVVNSAEKYGVKKFIMISTDKAVNPTNIMGASKRMCEMIVQSRVDSKTSFSCVRFGNVLGSNGSVIPLFARQIANGGPVTLTDKRIIRYFMTIPEASQLVMTAGAMAHRGELFVLDMGKPVKILELAENMIRLSGLVPYKDIDIKEVGLRPGEKLYEELLIKNENLDRTQNDMIFVERDTPPTREEIEEKLTLLAEAVEKAENERDVLAVKTAMKQAVSSFRDPEEVNVEADSSEEMKAVATV